MKTMTIIEKAILALLEMSMFTVAWFVTIKYVIYVNIGDLLGITGRDPYDITMFAMWGLVEILSIFCILKGNIKLARKEIKRFEE